MLQNFIFKRVGVYKNVLQKYIKKDIFISKSTNTIIIIIIFTSIFTGYILFITAE